MDVGTATVVGTILSHNQRHNPLRCLLAREARTGNLRSIIDDVLGPGWSGTEDVVRVLSLLIMMGILATGFALYLARLDLDRQVTAY